MTHNQVALGSSPSGTTQWKTFAISKGFFVEQSEANLGRAPIIIRIEGNPSGTTQWKTFAISKGFFVEQSVPS